MIQNMYLCVNLVYPIFSDNVLIDICLDSIKGDTIEFIVAKCEVEVLYRQWRSPIIYVSHQDSLAYTE
jgi:hypothetical protein